MRKQNLSLKNRNRNPQNNPTQNNKGRQRVRIFLVLLCHFTHPYFFSKEVNLTRVSQDGGPVVSF